MMVMLCILCAVGSNYIVGVFVLTRILDHAEQRWVERCPVPGGFFLVVSLWPGVLWLHWRNSPAVLAMTPAERRHDLFASIAATVIMAFFVLAAVGFVVFIVAAVVNAYYLDQECAERGGVPTRYACLKPDAIIHRGAP